MIINCTIFTMSEYALTWKIELLNVVCIAVCNLLVCNVVIDHDLDHHEKRPSNTIISIICIIHANTIRKNLLIYFMLTDELRAGKGHRSAWNTCRHDNVIIKKEKKISYLGTNSWVHYYGSTRLTSARVTTIVLNTVFYEPAVYEVSIQLLSVLCAGTDFEGTRGHKTEASAQ